MCCKPKKMKDLIVPEFHLNGLPIKYVEVEKYLGYEVCNDLSDDKDISRHIRALYTRGNMVIKHFRMCTNDVKLQLFRTYCTNLYCGQLWCKYRAKSISKIKVAFNNIFRSLMNLKRDISISQYMAVNAIDHFNVLYRKIVYGFRKRVFNSENSFVQVIVNSLFLITVALIQNGHNFYSNVNVIKL